MSFKQMVFHSTLILFIIGFSSCEKKTEIIPLKQNKNTQSNSAKYKDPNPEKFILQIDKECDEIEIISLTKQFLLSYDLSFQFKNLGNTNTKYFIYCETKNQFDSVPVNSEIVSEIRSEQNYNKESYLVKVNNIDHNINVFRSAPGGIGIGPVSVVTGGFEKGID